MSLKRQRSKSPILILIFLAVAIVAFFGIKTLLGKNIGVKRESEISYDDSILPAEKEFLTSILDQTEKYALPIKISAETVATRDEFTLTELVPVTSWYSTQNSLAVADALALAKIYECEAKGCSDYATTDIIHRLTPVGELKSTEKLLAIDGNYYLDNPEKGAVYRTLKFSLEENSEKSDQTFHAAEEDLEKVKAQIKEKLPAQKSNEQILTLAQTGVTALARMMVTKLNQVGDGAFFAEKIKDFLSAKDITHISNEVSFSDGCPGGSDTVVLCSDWRMLETIKAIGTDIIELTGNHNNDYSAQSNSNTIAKYEELGFKLFGGGKNEEEAKKPLEIDQKNAKITLLGYNQSTTSAANGGANGSTPGANLYDEATAKQQIAEAKARGDFVIVDVQYYECYSYPDGYTEMPACDAPISGQQNFFRHIIELGADMVVGTQAHQPQTYELYQGKPIYYGLGNLFFDQTYWPGTTRGYILTHYFLDGKYVQTKISPTVYGTNYQPELMDEASATSFLNRLLQSSPYGQ